MISIRKLLKFLISNLKINYNWNLFSFILYEISVGILYPAYSKIKSDFLPNENRGTIMNLFKMPLNLLVIILLFSMGTFLSIDQVKLLFLKFF